HPRRVPPPRSSLSPSGTECTVGSAGRARRGRTVTGRSRDCHGAAMSRWQDRLVYGGAEGGSMPKAILTINSRNYGAWSMRCWLLCRMTSLEFEERIVSADDASTRAELLQLSPSFLVPSLEIGDVKVWDTLAIAEYLNETHPTSPLLPEHPPARA